MGVREVFVEDLSSSDPVSICHIPQTMNYPRDHKYRVSKISIFHILDKNIFKIS